MLKVRQNGKVAEGKKLDLADYSSMPAIQWKGRVSTYIPEHCDTVIKVGMEGGSNTEMAVMVGINLDTFYQWIHKYEDFAEAVKLAEDLSMIWWEKAQRNGMMGKIPGFNAAAMIFGMKNRFPRHYRDVRTNEMTGINGGPLLIEQKAKELRMLTDDQLEALEHALMPLIEGTVINDDDQ